MSVAEIDEQAPLIFYTSRVPPKLDNRTQFQKDLAVWLILAAVALERLAFYSLAGNLVLFLTSDNIRWTSLHSVTALLIFFGTSYVSALLFSWISDAKLGRAKTIVLGFIIYIIGYLFIPLFANAKTHPAFCITPPTRIDESAPYFREVCSGPITAVLVVTAIGVGAVHANMAIFGAEQIHDQRATTEYFDRYYVAVNTGSLVAFGVIAYVQQNQSYFIGYSISTGLLVMTLVLFLAGQKSYTHIKPHDSVITNFFPVLINAFQTWRKHRQYSRVKTAKCCSPASDQYDNNQQLSVSTDDRPISFLDYANRANNGRFQDRVVDDIKSLRRIICMFLLLIPYWLIYLQSDTTFIVQGLHMRIPQFQSDTRRMPVVWLSLGDQVIIILIIIVLNTCVYKHLRTNNRAFSTKLRMIIGMIAAAFSMCITGTVEIFRQKRCDSSFEQTISNTTYAAADMSVYYQLPQYVGIGVSEVFASVASLEFAYLAAPQSAQSFVMSLRFCSAGLSSFVSFGYVGIYESIYSNFTITNLECKDAAKSELFYIYFFVLAGIQLIFLFVFLGCDRQFQILKASEHRFNTKLFIGSNSRTSTA